MSRAYRYQLFNLLVESQLEISFLEQAEETSQPIDLFIELGQVPAIKGKILYEDDYSQLAKDEYYLKVDEVARYYVANGHYICIEPLTQTHQDDMILFLLGSILGVVLAQREAIILHSSSVVINHQAILFCGNCGVGKSTTATAFRLKGYPLLSDDINLLEQDALGQVIAYKGFPQQKLCEDAMEKLRVDPSAYQKVDYAKGKYITNDLTCFNQRTVPVKAIYELCPSETNDVQICELKGREKLIRFMKNIFRLQVRYFTGTSKVYMESLVKLVNHVPYYVVSRPKETFCVDEVIETILNKQK